MSMLWFLSVLKRQLALLIRKSFYVKWTFTGCKERCLVNGFPSCISSPLVLLLSIIYINDLPNCACFFVRDNERISMTQERGRGEEPPLPFTPVPLARLNIMMVTGACCTVCETARGHSKNRIKSRYRCKQAHDFNNDIRRVSWDESNCALSLCRLRCVWNVFSRADNKRDTRNRTETQHRVFPHFVLRGLYALSTSREIIFLQPDHFSKLGQAKNR